MIKAVIEPEHGSDANQRQTDDEKAGNRTAAQCHIQCRGDTLSGGACHAHIRADGHIHADNTAERAGGGADEKSNACLDGKVDPFDGRFGDGFLRNDQRNDDGCDD